MSAASTPSRRTPASAYRGVEHERVRGDRLPELLLAIAAVVAETDIGRVVRTVVAAATRLVRADYGAFAVLGSDGELADFVQYGSADDRPASPLRLPNRAGLLDALVSAADAIRLDDVGSHLLGSDGSPSEPDAGALLGMPIRVRGRVFGVIYLTRVPLAPAFTPDDELQLRALGAQAGLAIANAGAFEVGRRHEEWLQTLTTVTTSLFSGRELGDVLPTVIRQARDIVDADFVAVACPTEDPGTLTMQHPSGTGGDHLMGKDIPIVTSLAGAVLRTGTMIQVDDLRTDPRAAACYESDFPFGPALFIPVGTQARARGVLLAFNRPGRPTFDKRDVAMLDAFAAQVVVSIELAERRNEATRQVLLEDRERIARDLHDVVIQRLFAIGLMLDGATHSMADGDTGTRVGRAVDELDQTIKEIRTTIFGLQAPTGLDYAGLRARAAGVVDQSVESLGFVPSLHFEGLIDTTVPDQLADEVIAVLREALSNAARHAKARHVDVVLAVSRETFTLTVTDDGVGIKRTGRRSGLRNMDVRAKARGGRLTLTPGEPTGTAIEWRVALRPVDASRR